MYYVTFITRCSIL